MNKLNILITPRENKENNYQTYNSRSKSRNKSSCVAKGLNRTPMKLNDTCSTKNLTPKKIQTPKNAKHTPDRQYSPCKI